MDPVQAAVPTSKLRVAAKLKIKTRAAAQPKMQMKLAAKPKHKVYQKL